MVVLKVNGMNKVPIILMGLGLALIPIHRVGNTFWAIGFTLVLLATVLIIMTSLRERSLTLGSKCVYIPLAIITLSTVFAQGDLTSKLIGVALFAAYVAAVNLKGELKLLVPIVMIGCASIVACNLLEGVRTGGIYSSGNYNLATGAVVMGVVLIKSKYQWILVTAVLVSLLFTGAEEALVALTVIGLTLLARRDWSKKILLPFGVLVIVVVVGVLNGLVPQFWDAVPSRVEALTQGDVGTATTERSTGWEEALTTVKPLGHGYEPFNVRWYSVHNVPLRILREVGPIAAIAYCFLMVYCLIKTKRKYIIVALIALGLFDHFLYTQLCVYTFVAIGIAMRLDQEDDLIFRRQRRYD